MALRRPSAMNRTSAAPALVIACVVMPIAAATRRAVEAWRTYETAATAASLGLTYHDAELPLDWLLVALVTAVLTCGAAVSFESERSRARWLYGAAASFGVIMTVFSARDPLSLHVFLLGAATAIFVVADRGADGRSHPSWLRDPRARIRGLLLAVLTCVVAIAVGLAEDERILPRSRALHETCWVVAILGGLLALVCLGAILVAWGGRSRGVGSRVLVIGFIVALLFGAFATYSLGFHWKETVALCEDGMHTQFLDERRRATEEGARRVRSIFSILPNLVFHFRYECDRAEEELRMIYRGECPNDPLPYMTCRCGAEVFPRDARCKSPTCEPPGLRCFDDR